MTQAPAQELTEGQTLTDKYTPKEDWGALCYQGPAHIAGPSSVFGLIVGMANTGKTAFMQSHPGAFILNLDLSSDTNPFPQAGRWPIITKDGMPRERPDGPLVELTWASLLNKKEQLITLARDGKPRPQTIVIDSLWPMMRMLKSFAVLEQNTKYPDKKADGWKDLHGMSAWDTLYDRIIDYCMDLRRVGYGVFIMAHLVNAKIQLGENLYAKELELKPITDNFYSRLYPLFELVAATSKEMVKESTWKEITTTIKGKERKDKKKIITTVTKHFVEVDGNVELQGIVKNRVRMPGKIPLSLETGWADFEAAYLKAIENTQKGS